MEIIQLKNDISYLFLSITEPILHLVFRYNHYERITGKKRHSAPKRNLESNEKTFLVVLKKVRQSKHN